MYNSFKKRRNLCQVNEGKIIKVIVMFLLHCVSLLQLLVLAGLSSGFRPGGSKVHLKCDAHSTGNLINGQLLSI